MLATITGLSFSFADANGTVIGDATADATFTLSLHDALPISALNGLSFTPTLQFTGSASVTITTNDLGNFGTGGALTDNDEVSITVTAVNDAPVNSIPEPQTVNEDMALVFSTASGNAISVADV